MSAPVLCWRTEQWIAQTASYAPLAPPPAEPWREQTVYQDAEVIRETKNTITVRKPTDPTKETP